MAETDDAGASVNSDSSSSGGGSSVASIISAINEAADTTSDNISQALMYENSQRAQQRQAGLARRMAEDELALRAKDQQSTEQSRELERLGMRAQLGSAMLDKEERIYGIRNQRASDKNRAKFGKAFLQGMAIAMGYVPNSDGAVQPRRQFHNQVQPAAPTTGLPQDPSLPLVELEDNNLPAVENVFLPTTSRAWR